VLGEAEYYRPVHIFGFHKGAKGTAIVGQQKFIRGVSGRGALRVLRSSSTCNPSVLKTFGNAHESAHGLQRGAEKCFCLTSSLIGRALLWRSNTSLDPLVLLAWSCWPRPIPVVGVP
jgi:hypothetical protein